jgi:hypothetical protein
MQVVTLNRYRTAWERRASEGRVADALAINAQLATFSDSTTVSQGFSMPVEDLKQVTI